MMSIFASARAYLFIFSINPIAIESIVPEWAVFVICYVITLTIRAMHPVRAVLALGGGWDRWLVVGITSAASCKLMVGILKVGLATPWAYGCLFGVMFVGMSLLPVFPAKWSPY
jgi:hypothetical protein